MVGSHTQITVDVTILEKYAWNYFVQIIEVNKWNIKSYQKITWEEVRG